MPKVNPHADPTRRDLGPAALGRTVKKLFSYYPVLAPVTFVCILFSYLVFHEKLTKKSAAGLVAVVGGTLLMLL